jgi:hypothetical protein
MTKQERKADGKTTKTWEEYMSSSVYFHILLHNHLELILN